MVNPNFFIVGAPKAGTSALSEYLRKNPEVFISKPKEPHYFADDLSRMKSVSSLDEYLAMFDPAKPVQKAVGEASVWYLFSNQALINIKAFDPSAKIIIMLRNPVDLAYSLHAQMLVTTDEDLPNFADAWHMQHERANGHSIPRNCREPAILQYRYTCQLGKQVERALAIFPKNQIYICCFEDFISDTGRIYEEVCNFLGVSPASPPEFKVVNPNTSYRSRGIANFVERPSDFFSGKILGIKTSHLRKIIRYLNTKTVPRPPMDNDLREELVDYFREDVQLLARIIDRDLSSWIITRA